jgi:hypothetical protein
MAQQPQQVRESEDQINTNVTRPNNQGVIPTQQDLNFYMNQLNI